MVSFKSQHPCEANMFCLRPGFNVIAMHDGVQLRAGDEEVILLRGFNTAKLEQLLKLLLEPQSTASLADQLGPAEMSWCDSLLAELKAMRLLVAAEPVNDDRNRYWFHATPTRSAQGPTPAIVIQTIGSGRLAEQIASLLEEHQLTAPHSSIAQVELVANSPQAAVIAWEEPNLSEVVAANRWAIANQVPSLFVDLSHGRHATLGPFFVPGEGACHECYRQWWRSNSRAVAELDAAQAHMLSSGQPLAAYGSLAAHRSWLAGMAVSELLALVVGHRPLRTLNRQITVNLEQLSTISEPVWRIPWCAACGTPTDGRKHLERQA